MYWYGICADGLQKIAHLAMSGSSGPGQLGLVQEILLLFQHTDSIIPHSTVPLLQDCADTLEVAQKKKARKIIKIKTNRLINNTLLYYNTDIFYSIVLIIENTVQE